MADIAVAFEAADVLSLASNWIPQNSGIATTQDYAEMVKATGDFQKFSAVFNQLDAVSIPYNWTEDTGLGTAMTNLLGSVGNGYMITMMRVETTNITYPVITFTAHNHGGTNDHTAGNAYAVEAGMVTILTGAYGAYDFAAKSSATVACIRSSYTISCEHVDQAGATGDHWVGTNIKGREEITCEYSGNIATPTVLSGWTVLGTDLNDSNEEHDSSTISATRLVLRT